MHQCFIIPTQMAWAGLEPSTSIVGLHDSRSFFRLRYPALGLDLEQRNPKPSKAQDVFIPIHLIGVVREGCQRTLPAVTCQFPSVYLNNSGFSN